MGTNCAVFVANLFCFTYEYQFIAQLVRLEQLVLLRMFIYSLRVIDDLISVANPVFGDYLSLEYTDAHGVVGIYPVFLTVTREQDSTNKVSFLDISVEFGDGHWFTTVYDKREHPPLSRVRSVKFPHASCFLSVRAKYGIITSRLHCYSRICQRKQDFIARTQLFLREFRTQGYAVRKMRGFVLRFLKSTPLQFPCPH